MLLLPSGAIPGFFLQDGTAAQTFQTIELYTGSRRVAKPLLKSFLVLAEVSLNILLVKCK